MCIGFVLMVGTIGAGLAGLATSSLNNRNNLEAVRNREYAADGAIEEAITMVRGYTCTPATTFVIDRSIVAAGIRVDWSSACPSVTASDGTQYPQRNVIFSACEDTGSACDPTRVIIRAQVNFEPAAGTVLKTNMQSWSVKR